MANIVITGRDADILAHHRTHAEEKLMKLERYYGGVSKIEGVLGHEAGGADVELVIHVHRGNPIVCHAQAKELYAAIDKAESQLTKFKERRKQHRSDRASVRNLTISTADADEDLEIYEDIVDKTEFSS